MDFLEYLRDHPSGGSAQEIADAIGVDRTSIYRYRDQARARDLTVDDTPGVFRLRSKDREELYEQVTLSRLEAHVLLSRIGPATNYSPSLRAVIDKLMRSQGQRGKRDLAATAPIYIPQQDELPDGLYDDLIKAITERMTLNLCYRNSWGEEKHYRFDPYVLVPRDDHLYLIGTNHNSREAGFNAAQSLRVDCIVSWSLTPEHFPKPDFNVTSYLRSTYFGMFSGGADAQLVCLLVSPEKAHAVARTTRHPSQCCRYQEDGSLIYELTVPLTPDLVYWIVGYGKHVRVLEPEELRERVLEHACGVIRTNEGG
jgi:predicted DNA-binding transcriptional regulator YafY